MRASWLNSSTSTCAPRKRAATSGRGTPMSVRITAVRPSCSKRNATVGGASWGISTGVTRTPSLPRAFSSTLGEPMVSVDRRLWRRIEALDMIASLQCRSER